MSKTGFKGGRLGIGTDDPIYPLDVVGDIRLTGGFRDASGNDFNFIALAGPDIVRTSDLADSITGIICKDNCVGIFNNNPSQSLDVSGNIRLTGDLLDANGAARVFSNWTVDGTNIFRNSKVTIGDNSVNTNYSLYVNGNVKFSETNVSKLKNHLSSGTGIWYDYANIQRFIINNEEKMRIHSDGNVGIGTADPETYKLKVNGKGYFSQIDLPGGDIQEQINGKQIKLSPTVRLNASYIGDNDDVSNTEYGYLNGVTSSIQTQLNGKLDKTSRATSAAKVFLNHGVNTNSNNSVLTANIGGNGDYFIYTNSSFCFNTNSGNVGIGTTSPLDKLHTENIRIGNWNGGGNGFRFWQNASADLQIDYMTGSSIHKTMMVMEYNGSVGIGTATFGDTRALLHLKPNAGISFQATSGSNSSRNWRLRPDDYGPWGALGFYCGSSNTDYGHSESDCVMCLTRERRMGIGTMNPGARLQVNGGNIKLTNGFPILEIRNTTYYNDPTGGADCGGIYFYNSDNDKGASIRSHVIDGKHTPSIKFVTRNEWYTNEETRMFIRQDGNVGIGTDSPGQKLEVNGTILSKKLTVQGQDTTSTSAGWGGIPVLFNGYSYRNYNYFIGYQYTIHYWTSNNTSLSTASGHTSNNNNANINMRCAHGLETPRVVWYSDKRIKENIVDVSDNMALDMVRKIPCRYYNYIDKINRGTGKVIGFIAQEVREFFPEATRVAPNFIPNCGILFHKDIIGDDKPYWTDLSDNKFKYTIPNFINNLTNTDGFKEGVKFQITTGDYDLSVNEVFENGSIQIREINIESDLESFIFDKKYSYIDIESMEVQDFHYIDKDKIFTLHHSAIQELDKQQQADKAKIAELEAKNTELETKVTTLESTLETVLDRLTALENTPTE